jgi:DNA polymerase-1
MLNPEAREKVWLPVRDENCTLCPLHENAQSVCLLGDGPVPSKVLLMGEAPGAREDDIAKPFSGPAGKYLDRILSEVGLPRESVYITNAVRCRPEDNATPSKGQINACSVYTRSELEIVRPDYVLLLGNVAIQAILNTSGVMKLRGTSRKLASGATAFITVHPAAVLRNPSLEGSFRSDLFAFAHMVKGETRRPETETKLIQSSKGLAKLCQILSEVETPIAFDVETGSSDPMEEEGGLHPWSPQGIIHTVAFSWEPGKAFAVSLEHPATTWDIPIERVYEALNLALAGKKMVGHNLKFDLAWMKSKGVNLYGHFDTLQATNLLEENRPKGLKSLARTYLGAEEYEANISFGADVTKLVKLAIYNGKDADYTLRLYHIFKEELKKKPQLLRLFVNLVMPACRAFVDIEANGIPVDVRRLEERHRGALTKIAELEAELLKQVPDDIRPLANFRSPVFLGTWLFDRLGMPILERGKKSGRPSTNESVLLRLQAKYPIVNTLMELRKWQKYESTYTRNWIIRVKRARKPRLYTSYNLAGTVTGRLSSDMQQVPRDLFVRSIIGTREGWKLVEADFAQIELRLAAMLAGDETFIRAFKMGEDPHGQTGALILGKPQGELTKEERKMAKSVNFGFLYGMGWRGYKVYAKEKFGVDVTDEEAQAYRKAFFSKYSALSSWHERQRRLVRNLGRVSSPIGRVRHLPTINSTDDGVQAEAERQAINSPIQGLASDMMVLSMVILQEKLDKKRSKIVGNVHDSVLLEARDDYSEEAASIVKNTMENLPLKRLFGWKPNVPIIADVTIGNHWGEK